MFTLNDMNPERATIYEKYGRGAEWAKMRSSSLKQEKRNWNALMRACVPASLLNDPNEPLMQSFLDEEYQGDLPNRINGAIKYMLDLSAELLMSAISITALAESTDGLKGVNPLSYNPKQFDTDYADYVESTIGDYNSFIKNKEEQANAEV